MTDIPQTNRTPPSHHPYLEAHRADDPKPVGSRTRCTPYFALLIFAEQLAPGLIVKTIFDRLSGQGDAK